MIATLMILAIAAVDTFETRWNAYATYDQTQCEGHGGFTVDWDPGIGVWAVKFAVQLDGTGGYLELGGVAPQPCDGGLPPGWSRTASPVYNRGRIVKWNVYWRAPFDVERGIYYNLLYPGGRHWVFTNSCEDNNAGWCLNDLNEIEVGGLRDPEDLRSLCASTSNNGGVVLETQCAPAEYCLPLHRKELGRVQRTAASATTWGAVKALYK